MQTTNKPWGYEELLEKNDNYIVKRLFMKQSHSCSLQYHEKKHETIYVVSGILKIKHGGALIAEDKDVILHPGMHFVVLPNVYHRMTGVTDVVYLECSTPELDDVIRIEDDYGRV